MRYTKAMLQYMDAHGGKLDGYVMPARRRNLESEMQRALIKWWRNNCRRFGVPEQLLFSIPNGFNSDVKRGSIMKLEGQRKGAPDLCLAVAGKKCAINPGLKDGSVVAHINALKHRFVVYHALYLELKTPTGTVSPEQAAFHACLQSQGYKVCVCRTLVECINEITTYLTK